MHVRPSTLAFTCISLAASETGIGYIPVPVWARVCLGVVTAGTIVASAVDSTTTRRELDQLRTLNDQPLWLREQREQEELVGAMIVQLHPEADIVGEREAP